LKSASDLGIPLVGIGLYYDQGYFRQRLDVSGWQHEDYIDVDHRVLPIWPAVTRDGAPLTVEIETRTGRILARVWRIDVGRNMLLLLDSNVDATVRRIGSSPRGCMAATSACASDRSWSSASAARKCSPR